MQMTTKIKTASYHIQAENFSNEHWPNGAWSLYRITGDEIASRVIRNQVYKPKDGSAAFYKGDIIARHSWCGYIGIFKTLPELVAAIEKDQASK